MAFAQSEQPLLEPHFSPDGHYIAYSSFESGRREVYVRTFPEMIGKWQVSVDGGIEPMWRGDGKELFYLAGGRVIAVDMKTGSSGLRTGVPKVLFEYPRLIQPPAGGFRNRYVTRDGRRFLFVAQPDQQPEGFNVLTNWMTELKK